MWIGEKKERLHTHSKQETPKHTQCIVENENVDRGEEGKVAFAQQTESTSNDVYREGGYMQGGATCAQSMQQTQHTPCILRQANL